MPQTRDRLLSRKKAAIFLDVSLRTIDRWTKEKFIPHLRIRGRVLYSKKNVLKWLEDFEVLGKDWEAEFEKNSPFLCKTDAVLQYRRKKRLQKLYKMYLSFGDYKPKNRLEKIKQLETEVGIFNKIVNIKEEEFDFLDKEIARIEKSFFGCEPLLEYLKSKESTMEEQDCKSGSYKDFLKEEGFGSSEIKNITKKTNTMRHVLEDEIL